MSQISNKYMLLFIDTNINDVKLFNDYQKALREYLFHCCKEVECLLKDDDDDESATEEIIDSDIEEEGCEGTCLLQIMEYDVAKEEYLAVHEYDFEVFQDFLSEQEDGDAYFKQLKGILKEKGSTLPVEVLDYYKEFL